jgi:hypothetical protein
VRRPRALPLLRQPLIRLLAINLAAGFAAALLMLGGLLALNPGNLRGLILADRMGATALGLLLFTVTFGSVAMGSAVMMLGRQPKTRGGSGGKPEPAPVRAR